MSSANIMIIEDETIIAKDIENILLNHGYNISGIYSRAEDAIESLKTITPDLILMDVVLKGDLDGIEAAAVINKKINVPIIFITAYADEITISRIKKTDPYGYFLKPFEEKELQTWIETTLHKFRSEKQSKLNEEPVNTILNSINEGVIVFDNSSAVSFMNSAAENITGWTNNDAAGNKLALIFNNDTLEEKIENLFSQRPSGKQPSGKFTLLNKNKSASEIEYSLIYFNEMSSAVIFEKSQNKSGTEELEKKLDDSYKEAENFAYFASHDLQEPLRMVASYVQLLKKRYSDKLDKEADEFIDFAVSGANRMKNLIDDLLLYSRINMKHFEPREVDCTKLVSEISEKLSGIWKQSNPVIKYENLPVIKADPDQLYQLFYHLITNSIKFNISKQPLVEIKCSQKDFNRMFTVSDNGIGIEKQYYEKIFEAFQRLHNHKNFPGTGIGLAVCKKIVEMHGGDIWVDSKPEIGTVFYFTISSELIPQ